MRTPIAIQMSQPTRAPKVRSAETTREPSSFMTTATQLPSAMSHETVAFGPESETAQKDYCPERVRGGPPGRGRGRRTPNGSKSTSRDDGVPTERR